jgi:hypothetical protein
MEMERLQCPGCGSVDLSEFNDELYRCAYCCALVRKTPVIPPNAQSEQSAQAPRAAEHTEENAWREKYERRKMQNAGLLTDFIVDENGTLTKYEGTEEHLVIPKGITAIGKSVFHFKLKLLSVVLPETVTLIDRNAFFCCRSLKTVNIPKSVKIMNRGAFNGCALESVVIPDGIAFLADDLFEECKKLTSITIPDSVKSIGDRALKCTGLTFAVLPDGVEHIGVGAFYECRGIKDFYVPKSVVYVDEGAFGMWEEDQTIYIYAKSEATWNKEWKEYCKAKIEYLD